MKTCFKCGEEKELSEFYKHKQMADGHLNKCKACTKMDAKKHRIENSEKIAEYKSSERYLEKARIRDRVRSKTPERRKRSRDYHHSHKEDPDYKEKRRIVLEQYAIKYPERIKANRYLNNAIRDKRAVRPDHCSCCEAACVPHGHHWNYEKEHWLDVEWLCAICHKEAHSKLK